MRRGLSPRRLSMRVSAYVKAYTSGGRIRFPRILDELGELFEALVRRHRGEIREEAGDVMHFLQLWLYWRFGLDGELWKCSMGSVEKFMARLDVWRKLYAFTGLDPRASNFCGNYKRREKVVAWLGTFGVGEARANEAYDAVVLPGLKTDALTP